MNRPRFISTFTSSRDANIPDDVKDEWDQTDVWAVDDSGGLWILMVGTIGERRGWRSWYRFREMCDELETSRHEKAAVAGTVREAIEREALDHQQLVYGRPVVPSPARSADYSVVHALSERERQRVRREAIEARGPAIAMASEAHK